MVVVGEVTAFLLQQLSLPKIARYGSHALNRNHRASQVAVRSQPLDVEPGEIKKMPLLEKEL
jgi:hypothetical protein